MITLRKLLTLKDGTRWRKYITLLKEFEELIQSNNHYDELYLKNLITMIKEEEELPKRIREIDLDINRLRAIGNIRFHIMSHLGVEPSEWDFTAPKDSTTENIEKLGIQIYLDDIRSPFNLGSLFRTAECFGTEKLILSVDSTKPDHKRAQRTSMGTIDMVNWEIGDLTTTELPIFALELGGTPIDQFKFPKKGIAIIGSEELGVSPENLKRADNSLGRVTIPLIGNKSSLNVANATAILLQRWSEYLRNEPSLSQT